MERKKKTLRDVYCFSETRDRCYWRRVKVIEEHREHHCSIETKTPLICLLSSRWCSGTRKSVYVRPTSSIAYNP